MKVPFKDIRTLPPGKILASLCLIVLILSLLPLLYISRYNHPTGDDIFYGIDAHLVWEDTHSIPRTIGNALQGVAHDYQTWQGTYVAMFLMRLQPTVFSEKLYFITPFLIIGLLLGGYWHLLCQLRRYVIPLERHEQVGIWAVLTFLSLQWVVSLGEAFYWYNGGLYYSGFYGITILLFGLLCKYIFTRKKTTLAGIFLLAFLVGGSNYLTLLWSMLVLFLTAAWCWVKKRPGRLALTCAALFQLGCFAVSAIAPGNAVRQAYSAQLSAVKTIIFSLWQGTAYLGVWMNGWWILGAMLLLVFVIPAIQKMDFHFPHPFLVTAFLYGMFCTLSCPTFYAQSSTGPGRALNIIYYGFIFTSYISLFYLAGWVYNRYRDSGDRLHVLHPVYFRLLALVVVLQVCIGLNDNTIKLSASVQALQDIIRGTAAAYDREYNERIELLQNSNVSDLVLMPYQNQPLTVYVGDYGPNADQGSNQALARWYGHDTIVIDYSSLGY